MARTGSRTRQRDASVVANYVADRDPLLAFRVTYDALRQLSALQELEDRRQWHPEGEFRPARAFVRSAARLIAPQPQRIVRGRRIRLFSPSMVAFAMPRKVAICVRRKTRREVLHALRVAGGGGMRKKRRFNAYSRIHC